MEKVNDISSYWILFKDQWFSQTQNFLMKILWNQYFYFLLIDIDWFHEINEIDEIFFMFEFARLYSASVTSM